MNPQVTRSLRHCRLLSVLMAMYSLALLPAAETPAGQHPFIGTFVHTQQHTQTEVEGLVDNPFVAGITTKIGWDVLETADGTYFWTDLDAMLTVAHNSGRKINLGVMAGTHTPLWLFSTTDTNMRGIEWFEDITVNKPVDYAPLPWNTIYMAKFDEFIRDVATHVKAQPYYPSIITVAITGGCYLGEEPFSPPVAAFGSTVPCSTNPDGDVARRKIDNSGTVIDNPTFDIAPATVDVNWQHWIDLFAREFPDKDLRFIITSKIYTDDTSYADVIANAVDHLVTNYGSRAIAQTDSLHGRQDALLHAVAGDEYDLMRNYNYSTYPTAPTPTLPTVHETIGSFHGQPFRQGRAGMTVFNHKDLGYPYYIQMWVSDCDGAEDPVFAKNILNAWYQYRNMTPSQMKDPAFPGSLADPAVDLYLADTTYSRPNSPSEAFDQWVTTPVNTAVSFTLSAVDTIVPTTTDPCTGAQNSDRSDGPYVYSIIPNEDGEHGTAVITDSVTGAVTYTPDPGYQGTDTFRWKVNDTFDSNIAIVAVEIGSVAHPPYFSLDPIARADSGYGLPNQMTSHAVAGSTFNFNVNYATDVDLGQTATLAYTVDGFVSGPVGGSDWLAPYATLATSGVGWARTAATVPGEYRWRVRAADTTGRADYATLVIRVEKSGALFYPTDDAHVNEATPSATGNYGAELNLKTATGQRRWGYLKFNVSGITGDIVSAKLKLKCKATQSGSTTSVYRVPNTNVSGAAWTESTITWSETSNSQPLDMLNETALLIATKDTPPVSPAPDWIEFDVTGYVGKSGEFSFGLQTSASGFVKYYPEETTGAASDPVLEITQR